MKNIILIAFTLFLVSSAAAQTEKIFVKSFAKVSDNFVQLHLEGNVEIKEWDEPFVRVHTTVSLGNASPAVLKSHFVQGRYRLELDTPYGDWFISSASRGEEVQYKGQILEEVVSYTVFVPKYMAVSLGNPIECQLVSAK